MEPENFLTNLMTEVSRELGRPVEAMAQFTEKLRQNWLDTPEAFADLDEMALQTLGLPLALQKKLLEKAQALKTKKSGGGSGLAQGTPTKMISEATGPVEPLITKDLQKNVNELLDLVYKEVFGSENLINTLKMLHTLVGNVAANPTEAKFKVVRLDKPAIMETLGKSPSSLKVLKLLGFVDSPRGYLEIPEKVSPRVADMQETLKFIEAFGNKIATIRSQLGVASISSTNGRANSDIAAMNNSSLSSDYDMLMKLKADREAMVKDTVPRQSRIITQDQIDQEKAELIQRNKGHFAEELTQEEEMAGEEADNAKAFTALQKKQFLALFTEGPSFESRTRKELKQLLDTPLFLEAKLRIKLPDGRILESRFSPREKMRHVREEVLKYYNPGINWYMYIPPNEKLELRRTANNTLEELRLVPGAVIYIKVEE